MDENAHQGLEVTKAKWSDIRQRMTSELVCVCQRVSGQLTF